MKHKFIPLAGLFALAVLAPIAGARDTAPIDSTYRRNPNDRHLNPLGPSSKASEVIGMAVKNQGDERIGKVADLAVDLSSGRIVHVIVSLHGMHGRHIAVPPSALRFDPEAKVLRLDAERGKLENAPPFELNTWNDYYRSDRWAESGRYFGAEPYTRDEIRANADGRQRGDWTVERGSKLLGARVENLQGEKLGKVDNLMVDLPAGRVVAVILSSGGFLGMHDEQSVVPPQSFRFSAEGDPLRLDVDRERLTAAPHFHHDQYPDLADQEYTKGVYRAYRVDPYFSADRARDRDDRYRDGDHDRDADNTDRNKRDRDSATLTPADQGRSDSDVAITRQIRKDIVAADVSTNAKNVKIITRDGRVTLRGPVKTSEEKSRLEEIAERAARSGAVDNQLEVERH